MNIIYRKSCLESVSLLHKMAKVSMDAIKANAELTKQTITALKSELLVINEDYNNLRAKQLREENAKLLAAVEAAAKKLVQVEIAHGVPQVPLPQQKLSCTAKSTPIAPTETGKGTEATRTGSKSDVTEKVEKPKKEKKQTAAKKDDKEVPEAPVDVGRLDLRVAKVLEVQRHPDADTLYLLKIDCGDDTPRTVCSGLVKHIALEELQDRCVVLLCNLKPAKMRGIMSEAMVMCASTPEKVEVLSPPAGTTPGDLVECEGYPRQPDAVMNPKKKIFEAVAPDLHTNDQLAACYKGVPLRVVGIGGGSINAQTLKNVAVK